MNPISASASRNILITGGAGFIGSHIVESAVSKYNKVIVLDNLSTGKIENISRETLAKIEFIKGDITDLNTCIKATRQIDLICHQAALASVTKSLDSPLENHHINITGFLNILVSARKNGVKRIVYASSSSVYGNDDLDSKVENQTGELLSPYALSKSVDEIYAKCFTDCYNLECIGLRYFNIFGSRQDPNGEYAAVIPKFIDLMLNGKQPHIYGDGTNTRDFTHISNVVHANLLALETNNKNCFGQVYNVGCGQAVSLNTLVKILNRQLKLNILPIYKSNRIGDISHSKADLTKIESELGYKPITDFEKGLAIYLN